MTDLFASILREGEIVSSPSGRQWYVVGWSEAMTKISLSAIDGSGDECELDAKLLRYVSGQQSGELLLNIGTPLGETSL